ncbi:MAG: enoyl-CoA hydratase/isomerase family protein [Microthrixaceae bacterium]
MTNFDEYQTKYDHAVLSKREDGVLEIRFHSDGGPLQWSMAAHKDCEGLFGDIADDPSVRVVIMTGTGDEFSGPNGALDETPAVPRISGEQWDQIRKGAKDLLGHLLRIEAPVIAAVNGPARRHAELPLLSDIVVASEQATFQDTAHFISKTPPGDGQHVILPLAMGINRARYFLLTGQEIKADDAYRFGLISEVVPHGTALERAWELADLLMKQPPLVLRNSRLIMTQIIKRDMHDFLEYGLNLEALAIVQ